ncbi:metal ABC transporter solute-binding protein, Zn/Mn family [Natribacillus halophilus]|uniref:Manganese/zinc/iron transport system substrate-binding protein n=1 Tax=Natribacillus halophilus TaxID=549003 RepID=A0A1G8LPN2_9BACI|nr:zinc ABC transporter substrate-binding protein [Natribacillus halophilus]SDI57427.1 manganese/zinc/iron transport system substrate-binding protein [Natribacillus halophilus]
MKKPVVILSLFSSLGLLVSACSDEESGAEESAADGDGPIQVTSTTSQISDIVENVGGEHVDNTGLMGPGIDPHDYEASQGDVETLDEADIIFWNGLNLEEQMTEMLGQMGNEKPVYTLGEEVPDEDILEDEEEAGTPDPHIWFDPELWSYAVEGVADGLAELDPENEDDYRANADTYIDEIQELQAWSEAEIENIDEESRVLVTAHDAFQYFGDAVGMDVMGLQGISTEAEVGLSDVQGVIDEMIERDINAIFAETSVSDSAVDAVIEGAQEQGHEVENGGALYSDAMGEPDTEEGTYVGMYEANVNQIVEALD